MLTQRFSSAKKNIDFLLTHSEHWQASVNLSNTKLDLSRELTNVNLHTVNFESYTS